MSKILRRLPKIEVEFTDEAITAGAGSVFLARMAHRLGLPLLLRRALRLKKRARGVSDAETMLSLVYNLAHGDGCLSDLERLRADEPRQTLLGLSEIPGSRRAGEYLARFEGRSLRRLGAVSQRQVRRIASAVIQAEVKEKGYVAVFPDASEIEVNGHQTEGAALGYTERPHLWLHSVFVGPLWVSQRLYPGNESVKAGWRRQIEKEVTPLFSAGTPVWLRGDNAYYGREIVDVCEARGWDFSISVTNDNYKAPLKEALAWGNETWTPINDDGTEEATVIYHRPAGWKKDYPYVVVRTYWENRQKLMIPRISFILVSRTDLPTKELVARHRGKQGQESLQKGPLIDLDHHHPPCAKLTANQAFYTAGQMAHNLLIAIQHLWLPDKARHHRIRTIIRDLIRVAGRLVRHGRQWVLKFTKSAFRLDWLSQVADRMEMPLLAPS